MPVFARNPHSASVCPSSGLSSGTGTHSIVSSPSAMLEVLDDLRPLVGAADHGPELPRFVVVEADHLRRLVVVIVTEEVDLADAVVVQDDREPPPSEVRKPYLTPIPGSRVSLSSTGIQRSSLISVGAGNRWRPIHFDSFISTTPIVAVAST